MPVNTNTAPWCARCYAESAMRAAREQADPGMRAILLRTARAFIDRQGVSVTEATHAMHPKRLKPWPSEAAA